MKHKSYLVGMLVIKIIAFAVSLFLWIGGLSAFLESGGFQGWIIWGAVCLIAWPLEFLKSIVKGVRDGAKDGSNKYVIRDYGSFYTTSNKTFSGAILGFFAAILAYLFIGPVLIPIKIITHLMAIVSCIINLRLLNEEESRH